VQAYARTPLGHAPIFQIVLKSCEFLAQRVLIWSRFCYALVFMERCVPAEKDNVIRRRLDLRGQVQGVGFRPFVYRLAAEFGLGGLVGNNSNGAFVEIEGPTERLEAFEAALVKQLPPLARITELRRAAVPAQGAREFRIATSQADPHRRPEVTPDAATCADCLRELFDPADRRYRYPFINCTNCGPRYSIIKTVPYDRPATTMAVFTMCPACQREYDDPADRRFHAQPNACPVCGPQLGLCRVRRAQAGSGERGSSWVLEPILGDPIREAARLLADGRIVAVKGIGGYHLACRADREDVVQKLRQRKLRDGKPLAVMVPSIAAAREFCRITDSDLAALATPAAPIVLAFQRKESALAPSVAPGVNTFGIMLPYAPLHHLLFAEGLGPLVMTSANLSGQPLTFRDEDAFAELHEVADAFLIHDREIFRPIDDSVVFTFAFDTVPIRRARGYAPRPIRLAAFDPGRPLAAVRERRILAVGGELKSTVCLLHNGEAILSEHLGDLSNPAAYRHFVEAIARLEELYGFKPDFVAHDLHPQYLSSGYARHCGAPRIAVQHHHAHVASVMAEFGEPGPMIGLSCDGTGYGTDGAVWGCELLHCERGDFERLGHLEYFPLVGGDAAAVDTWRPALALTIAVGGSPAEVVTEIVAAGGSPAEVASGWSTDASWGASADRPTATELAVFRRQLTSGMNAPPTSSLGRVFDGVSYLLGLCRRNRHEAEAAMALEAAAGECADSSIQAYGYQISERDGMLRFSIAPMVRAIVVDRRAGVPVARIAARFHETIARVLVEAATRASQRRGIRTVALSGGCFANRRLLGRVVELLETDGLKALYHRNVPSGDGGLALGQAMVAAWVISEKS
jgi:hydrogenase maturation protein HypF